MLDKILELGPKIEAMALKPEQFPAKCEDILKKLEFITPLEDFSKELGQWLLNEKLPKQLNVYNNFGQPPVTLFNNGEFVVDLYFWMQADTSIHSHSFAGAFKVLFGKSLHENYKIQEKKIYSEDVILNTLTKMESKNLLPGDTVQIIRGNGFNHRVVHLGKPTITLCIRTISDLTIPQWHHFENGLSILKQELKESIYKNLFYGDYLYQLNPKEAKKFLGQFIRSIRNSEAMNLFEQLSVDTMGISEDAQEMIYNLMMKRFNKEEWFQIYEANFDQES